jgi:hypothetical protein
MSFPGGFRIRPVYLLVIEKVLSFMTLSEVQQIEKGIGDITKQRDNIVSQIYKIMTFLTSLLILVLLIELNVIAIPNAAWGVTVHYGDADRMNNQDIFIFGFLLVGNIVALLFSSAMVKMFMLEYLIDTYCSLRVEGPSRYIASVAYRFYVFIFGTISDQKGAGIPNAVTLASRVIHCITVIVLPITFIVLYCCVLALALTRFWTEAPSGMSILGTQVELWYVLLLSFFNLVTLSLYAFAFFPCITRVLSEEDLAREIEARADLLWEKAGRPRGTLREIELLAERQIKLRYHML